jgi:serine/threonine protein kinase
MMKAERKSQLMAQSYDRNTYGGGYNGLMTLDDEQEEMMKDLNRAENIYDMKHKGVSKDDFEMVKVIGRGGFGKVYMVRKRSNGKIYAMKVLSKDQIASKNLNLKTRGKPPSLIETCQWSERSWRRSSRHSL